jgi:hypothetical protein
MQFSGPTKFYVVSHIKFLWRPALCGAEDAVLAREAHERSQRHIISIKGNRVSLRLTLDYVCGSVDKHQGEGQKKTGN